MYITHIDFLSYDHRKGQLILKKKSCVAIETCEYGILPIYS